MASADRLAFIRHCLETSVHPNTIAAIDAVGVPDFVLYTSGHAPLQDDVTLEQFATTYRTAVQGIEFMIETIVDDPPTIAWLWRIRGIHTSPIAGILPTGKPLVAMGVVISHTGGGRP
jgi:predicted ester cyclase